VDAHDFGGRDNASHIVLVGAQEFAMALRRLSANQPVKMVVDWKGRRATLTEKLFIDIATSFLTAVVLKGKITLSFASPEKENLYIYIYDVITWKKFHKYSEQYY
jgi:hypothetical protein